MAVELEYFALVDRNDIVTQVVTVDKKNCVNQQGIVEEAIGKAYLDKTLGIKDWVMTSYDGAYKGIYAGIGDSFDKLTDEFKRP